MNDTTHMVQEKKKLGRGGGGNAMNHHVSMRVGEGRRSILMTGR